MRSAWLPNLLRSQLHAPARGLFWLLSLISLLQCLAPRPLQAQSIITAPDGTQTLVTPNGSQFNISGGQLSPDQLNQFHSFLRFNLNSGEIANFLANPSIQNILARVVGGDPSVINGLIQVSGGNPNLYLINPAGVIFGPTASLNVPAAFTATTANGIQVGSSWFNASGTNDFSTLSGTPNAFAFAMAQPGAIANFGTLSVNSGQSLALLGGTVVSTGTLNAPGGQLLVTSIPGQSLVRLSQPGNLLSLDIQPLGGASPVAALPFNPTALPQLLTAGSSSNATGVTVNPNGTVDLTGSGLAIAPGDVVVRNASAQTLTLRANQNLTLVNSQLQSTGDLNLFAQNAVQVRDSVASPFIAASGGQLYLQGNQAVDVFALNHPASGFFSGGNMLFRSANTVSADAHFFSGGNFQIQQLNGQLGSLFSPYDPVIRASGDVSFASYSGASLHIIAGGSVTVPGTIEITGRDTTAGLVETITLSNGTTVAINGASKPTLDIRAGTTNFALTGSPLLPSSATGSNITIEVIRIFGGSTGGQVLLTNNYFPNPALAGGSISVSSTFAGQFIDSSGVNRASSFIVDSSGTINLTKTTTNPFITGGTNLAAIDSGYDAGSITLLAQKTITTGQYLDTSAVGSGNGGNISLTSYAGSIVTGGNVLTSTSGTGNAGTVTFNAATSVTTDTINTSSAQGNGGSIALTSTSGSISTGNLSTNSSGSSAGNGGNVTLKASTTITTGNINTSGIGGNAGSVLIDPTGDVQVNYINAQSTNGAGGTIDITTGRYFRAVSGFSTGLAGIPNSLLSLSTIGGSRSGKITIRHGGNGITPFIVGNASVNGTAYSIASSRTNYILASAANSYSGSYSQGDIQILTVTKEEELKPQGQDEGGLAIAPACGLSGAGVGFISSAEDRFTSNYEEFLGRTAGGGGRSADNACDTMFAVSQATGVKPSLLYVSFVATDSDRKDHPKTSDDDAVLWRFNPQGLSMAQPGSNSPLRRDTDQLELVMVTPRGTIRKRLPRVTRAQVMKRAQEFRLSVTNVQNNNYLESAQQLYTWIVAPLEAELQAQKIDNLVFLMDTGLRSLPIAALHDGKQFLIEKYSLGLMPSVSLTDTRFVSIRDAAVLAMGASQFQDQTPLPAVPTELKTITQLIRTGKAFLNDAFTIANLKIQRKNTAYRIVHLATHGEFRGGSLQDSYIQFADRRLGLDQIRLLGLNDPPVELLVLSACRTALGNEQAELGFGGLAVQAGVKSALASLWSVSDEGTLSLMSQFYSDLKQAPIKAEALRRAQLAMLRKQIRLENGQLVLPARTIDLPPELANLPSRNFSHPYYWAAFTMIGSPW